MSVKQYVIICFLELQMMTICVSHQNVPSNRFHTSQTDACSFGGSGRFSDGTTEFEMLQQSPDILQNVCHMIACNNMAVTDGRTVK